MAGISAKFRVTGVVDMKWPGQTCKEVTLTPDYGDGKNSEWATATPSGVIRMTITNPSALEQLENGTAVSVLFTPEPK